MALVRAGDRVFDIDAVAFDKDGTLIDLDATWAPISRAWIDGVAGGDTKLVGTLADRLGLDLGTGKLRLDSTLATGPLRLVYDETLAVLSEAGHPTPDDRLAAGAAAALAAGPAQPLPLADLPRLFTDLRAVGLATAVVTADDLASAHAILEQLRIDHLIDVVVAGDETAHAKPAPDALELAAERLGVPLDRLLMVGDSLTDQGAARAAGCPFVAVGGGAARDDCDAAIDHVALLTTVAEQQ